MENNSSLFVKQALISVISDLGLEKKAFSFSINQNQYFGDYSSNIAFLYQKELKMTPYEVACLILENILKKDGINDIFQKVVAEKNGYINFFVSEKYLSRIVSYFLKNDLPFQNFLGGDETTYIIEFSSPNMVKPFTIGYLRSTIIGDSVAKIYSYVGKKVVRDNHLGDWGIQFGKIICAVQKYSSIKEVVESNEPYQELLDHYLRFSAEEKTKPSLTKRASEIFAAMERGESDVLKIWSQIRHILERGLNNIYSTLGITFDTISWESSSRNGVHPLIEDLVSTGLAKISQGAVIVEFDDENLPVVVLRKSDGSALYAARELFTDKQRFSKHGNELVIINEVGVDQSTYLSQIYSIECQLGWCGPDQRFHLSHGMYRLEGVKMVSEKGNYLYMLDVLSFAKNKVADKFKKASEEDSLKIALAAIKFNDLRNNHASDVEFSMETFTDSSKGTGPYVQQTACNIRLFLQNNQRLYDAFDINTLTKQELLVIRHLEKFDNCLTSCVLEVQCTKLAVYVVDLCTLYNKCSFSDLEDSSQDNFVTVSSITEKTISLALGLLGIQIPKQM